MSNINKDIIKHMSLFESYYRSDASNEFVEDLFFGSRKMQKTFNPICKNCDNATCKRSKDALKCKNYIKSDE